MISSNPSTPTGSRHTPSPPELLAPAGDRDCIRAAIENGADAVYFGLDCGFNARARAANFDPADLPELMAELHSRGVKGYVTFNTLVFPSELAEVEQLIRQIAAAGVDAVLVQDLGLCRLIRALCPDLAIHASTQMTLSSAECIALAESLGIERVVLPRELSIREIGDIHHETTMPLEAFVHGALCVAYSGQCLTSESLGGRSANRGQCAQACRMTYELVCDGQDVDLGQQQYLLSPTDLAAYDLVPELIAAGVTCFKIEGRLKTAEYVANITRHYRRAIDSALAGRELDFTARDVEEMQLSFSRGFSHGWLDGCHHKRLVPGLSSAKRGVFLGQITAVGRERIEVELASSIKPGDGVVFEGDRAANEEQGGRVYEVRVRGKLGSEPMTSGRVELGFAHGSLELSRLWTGQQLWKTDDPQLNSRLRKTFTGADPLRRTPLDVEVHAAVGEPLRVVACIESGLACEVVSEQSLVAATKHPLTEEVLRQQLGRLGGTPYELRALTCRIEGAPMVPLSVLGKLRHEIVSRLEQSARRPPTRRIASESALASLRAALPPRNNAASDFTRQTAFVRVLCRSLSQLDAALGASVELVYVDFQDIRQYGEAVRTAQAYGAQIHLATPRIQKPDELGIFHVLARHGADGILVRNLAGIAFYRERQVPLIADFSLNAANELTVTWLREQGAQRVTTAYDLNRDQLLDVVGAVPPEWLEVVIHQHMPMFHMEHCVFCAVLSPGTNKTNCGRPCDHHQVRLRDRIGMEHPLKADVGCRNTLFNAVPQSAAEVVPTLIERGVRNFRIELLDDEPEAQIAQTIELYRQLLAGRITGREVWSRLKAANRVGVTRGTLEERRNPLAII